jgi:4-amino-4-deoxy-L-arabinose transferase-like glycosyltransferase
MKYLTGLIKSNMGLILLCIIIVAVFRIVYALPVKWLEPDDTTFYVAMQAFEKGEFQLTQTQYNQYRQQVGELRQYIDIGNGIYVLEKNPLYAFFLSRLHAVKLERFSNMILASLALFAFYKMIAIFFNRKAAVISSLILLFDATFLGMFYRIYMDDFASMAFVLIGASLYVIALNKNNIPLMIASGFVLAISVATRYTNIAICLAILIYTLIVLRKDIWKLLSTVGWAVLGSAAPLILLMVYHTMVLGGPFKTGYSYTIGYTQFIFQFILNGQWSEAKRILIKNLLSHPRLLLEGFPSITLLPAGLPFIRDSRTKYPLMPFFLLWFLAYFLLYFQYLWLRWDSYIYETRFYLPFVPVLSACAGIFIVNLIEQKSKYFGYALLFLLIVIDLGVFSNLIAGQVFAWMPVQR